MGKKWGWYASIYHLAGGDVLKMPEVERTEIGAALTILAYEQDLHTKDKVKGV